MDALVEGAQPQQADRADEREPGAQHQQRRDGHRRPKGEIEREVGGVCHSITSPRMRNFENAAVETKPSSEMSNAASK